ncbi:MULTISPECIES: RIP metalloprotease [Corynebacterium]|uniref:M50 family metallopeptidase n=1 Tax=Corynebacterium TaxID=1716 RepID=UPI0008A59B13|nr:MULTISPECIES: M50 family metallopeptidase [Corynebacterium]MCT1441136.1 RIP metalloprotease [Corynebacterium glucuronolyticum]MCT1562182.1 RIP metalloprotease [Corynebacterium glucuronolyticum]OFO43717.1 signaling protein [Corynebacterium sp. HMSC073D01]
MSYFLGVVLFAVGIAVTIALHEFGHFAIARLSGMRVRRFFVGFGPTLWKITKGHTDYGFKAIPLGGFCDIAGMTALDEMTPEEESQAMYKKPAWKRIAVMSGGIAMNILVGTVILYGLAVTTGLPNPHPDVTPVVAETKCIGQGCEGSGPAFEAGIRPGDAIRSVGGVETPSFIDVRNEVFTHPNETVDIAVERNGELLTFPVRVESVEATAADGTVKEVGVIGVSSAPIKDAYLTYNPVNAVGATASYAGDLFVATWDGLKSFPGKIPGVVSAIFGGERDQSSPMSVVGASRVGGELVERSLWAMFWMLLSNLNYFLALFNLIPLPPLDGGHIAVVIYEKIRDALRRLRGLAPAGPADYTKLMPITYAASLALLVIGGLVIVADVVNPIKLF